MEAEPPHAAMEPMPTSSRARTNRLRQAGFRLLRKRMDANVRPSMASSAASLPARLRAGRKLAAVDWRMAGAGGRPIDNALVCEPLADSDTDPGLKMQAEVNPEQARLTVPAKPLMDVSVICVLTDWP